MIKSSFSDDFFTASSFFWKLYYTGETVLSGDTLYLFFYSIHFHIRLETQFAINFEYALQRSCILIRKTNDYETKRCPWTKAHTTLHPLCFRTNWIYSFWISILIVFLLSFYPWCARFIFQGQILKRNIFPLGKGRKVEVPKLWNKYTQINY